MIPSRLPVLRPLAGFALLLAAVVPALAQDSAPTAPPAASTPSTDVPTVPSPTAPATGGPNESTPAQTPPAATEPAPVSPATDAAPAAPADATPGTGPRALDAQAPGEGAPAAAPATIAPAPAGTGAPAASDASAPTAFEENTPIGVETGLPHDLSPWGMFMAADWVVKGVMIGLAFASLVTWTVWLAKALELSIAKRRARAAVRRLEEAQSLSQALGDGKRPLRRGPVATLARTAAAESELSGGLSADGVKERVAVAMQRIEARSGRQMARGTGLLATIGSTAPFVGLFGTVWGIMNSFVGIAESNTTNLAVVAPGIAEALLATAIGLVAAIPAVIIYNVFARSIAGYRSILSDGSAAVLRHLSRDLDRRDAGIAAGRFMPAAAE